MLATMKGMKEICDAAAPLGKLVTEMRKQNELIFNKGQIR